MEAAANEQCRERGSGTDGAPPLWPIRRVDVRACGVDMGLCGRGYSGGCMGGDRSLLSFLRSVDAGDEYGDVAVDVPPRVPDSEHAESRHASDQSEIERADQGRG